MKPRTYEGMYLFDPSATSNWKAVESEIERIMERAGAELIGIEKWDERRLAYEIKRRKRGCYVRTYFRAPRTGITGIERDAQLSETILRLLVLTCDLTEDQLEQFREKSAEQSALLKAPPPEEKPEAAKSEPEPKDEATAKPETEPPVGDVDQKQPKDAEAPAVEPASPASEAPEASAETEVSTDTKVSAETAGSDEKADKSDGDQKPET